MQAIDAALRIFRRPNLVRAERRKPLPDNILSLLRIASGGDIAPEFLTPDRANSETEAKEASVFYIQQVLLSPKSNEYRQLGLTDRATPQQINEHKRYMLKWLHPDRNRNRWESALFQRVVNAAAKLENQEVVAMGSDQHVRSNSHSAMQLHRHSKSRHLRAQTRTPRSKTFRRLRKFVIAGSTIVILMLIAWRFSAGRWFDWYEAQILIDPSTIFIGSVQISS